MASSRKPYPSNVSDEVWALVAPYLTLLSEDFPQRSHRLREVFNGLRYIVNLSVARQQMVEIAKAVATGTSLMILDEPTAALGLDEISRLHALLRRMRDQGASLLYVSHRLDEVVSLVDDVTILRGGKVVSAAGATEVKIDRIVSAMIGSDVKEHYPKVNTTTGKVVLEAKGISTRQGVSNVDLTLHAGEVHGLGGVLGAGRIEIAGQAGRHDRGRYRWRYRDLRMRRLDGRPGPKS